MFSRLHRSLSGLAWYGLAFSVLACGLLPRAVAATTPDFVLPDLHITAERDAIAPVFPFSAEEVPEALLRVRHAPSPNDLLKLNPSISLPGSMKGMAAAPSIRGFPNWTNQVLLDGTPVSMPWANYANLTAYPLRRLTGVTVSKGGESILYGPGGLAGAINLSMPTAADLPGVRLYLEPGGQASHHAELSWGHSGPRSDQLLLFSGDTSDGYQPHASHRTRSLLYRGRVETGSGWTAKGSLLESRGNFELPDLGDPTMTPQTWDAWDFSHRDLTLERALGGSGHLTLRAYRNSEFSHALDFADTRYSRVTAESTMDMSVSGQEVLYDFRAGRRHRLGMGWQRHADVMLGAAVGGERRRLVTDGGFVSDRIRVSPRLNLQLTGRRDTHSTAGEADSWAATAQWKVTPRLRFALDRSERVRFPSMRELYMDFQGTRVNRGGRLLWQASIPGQGDLSARPERARCTDLSLTQRLGSEGLLSLGHFHSDVQDLIDRVMNPAWPVTAPRFWWRNVTDAELEGWEARLEHRLSARLRGWVGYTRLAKADDLATGRRLDERPYDTIVAGVSARWRDSEAALIATRRGRAPYQATGGGAGLAAAELPAGVRLDLSVRHSMSRNASLFLYVDNLTDARIETMGHTAGAAPILDTPRRFGLGIERGF